jgi:hypothetical protein
VEEDSCEMAWSASNSSPDTWTPYAPTPCDMDRSWIGRSSSTLDSLRVGGDRGGGDQGMSTLESGEAGRFKPSSLGEGRKVGCIK